MIKKRFLKNKLPLVCCSALVCMISISACKKEQSPTAPPPSSQTVKAVPVQPKPVQKAVSSASALKLPSVNQFDFSNKKDPFKAFVVAKATPSISSEFNKVNQRNLLPIHSFDVSQFKLIGIITGGRESQAMVTDPNGKGYVLKAGMTIGKNSGKIISITSSGIDVLEQFRDDNGRVRKENIKLTLPRKQ